MFDTYRVTSLGTARIDTAKRTMALAVRGVLPFLKEGRDQDLFLTKMDEAMFWATRSIASREDHSYEQTQY